MGSNPTPSAIYIFRKCDTSWHGVGISHVAQVFCWRRVFSPPVWPVKLPGADFAVPASPAEIGGLRVSWQSVAHPDGCVSYRVDEPATGASVVVATDRAFDGARFARVGVVSRFPGRYRHGG